MGQKFDFKKEDKELYMPGENPVIVDVMSMPFIMVDGKGNPNTSKAYKDAMEILYGLSNTIKFGGRKAPSPEGYFEYVIAPLEGLWKIDEEGRDGTRIVDKDRFSWTVMIRQPSFVTFEIYSQALEILRKKKPELDFETTRFEWFEEGKCAQIMHTGTFDSEPATIDKMEKYIEDMGYKNDISMSRWHHEIYLNDFRKIAPDKMKTIIRHPVA